MKLSPEKFIEEIASGKKEDDLNRFEEEIKPLYSEIKKLINYGHTYDSAVEHLNTDYSDGFTVCKKCGTFYHLGEGFTKHISDGCFNCEGEENHRKYYVNASKPKDGGFPARWMCAYFDDKMSYCFDKAQIQKYYSLIPILEKLAVS